MLLLAAALPAEGGQGPVAEIASQFGVTWPLLISQIILFVLVGLALKTWAYGPLLRMLEQRRERIAESLANADKIKAELAATGEPWHDRAPRLARAVAQIVASYLDRAPPKTLVAVFGDHGFGIDGDATRSSSSRQGGASPEEVFVPVSAWLTGPVPDGREVWYQKHMAHHLLPMIDRGWLDSLTHAFLIREPDEMVASLLRTYPDAGLADTGLPQQAEIFDRIASRLGRAPPVVLASDVLKDPAAQLEALCAAVGIPYLEAMLSWPAGPRDTDGAWAPWWYAAVESSTGFEPYRRRHVELTDAQARLVDECRPYYEKLYALRLKP